MAETVPQTGDDRYTLAIGSMTVTRESDGKVFHVDEGRKWPGMDYGQMVALQIAIVSGLAKAIFPLGIEEAVKKGKWTDVLEKVSKSHGHGKS